jgi:hypothetical protein
MYKVKNKKINPWMSHCDLDISLFLPLDLLDEKIG